MRRTIISISVLLPLVLTVSYAAQTSSVDPPATPWIFSSDDSGSSSYLGVDIADVTADRLGALKLKEEKGVEVTMVDQDAPAGKAGIKEHDVILNLNGTPVESAAQLRRMIHETPPGRVVTFGLSRDGAPMTVKVQLADKHKEFSSWAEPHPDVHVNIPEIHVPDIDIPSINMVVVTSSARSGLMVENITPQLGDFFGVKNGNGVLVRSVDKGSRAERAGFHAGDVIVKVNDQVIHDTNDFSHAVRSRKGNSVSVGIMRDRREQTLSLTLPEHRESSNIWEEESFDAEPLRQAESALELSQLQNQLATIRPEMELAWQKAAADSRKAAEELRKSLCTERKKYLEETKKQREQFKQQQERMLNELQRMRQQLRRDWAEL